MGEGNGVDAHRLEDLPFQPCEVEERQEDDDYD